MKYLLIPIIIGLALFLTVAMQSRADIDTQTNLQGCAAAGQNRQTVVVFGDSLAQGVGATSGNDVASLLSARLGIQAINAGVSGDTTATAFGRVDQDVIARNPGAVVIILGGNDILQGTGRQTIINNLNAIVGRICQAGIGVVLVEVGVFPLADYSREFRQVAAENNTALVADALDDIIGRSYLMSDLVHPNDEGYALFTDRIELQLRRVLDGTAVPVTPTPSPTPYPLYSPGSGSSMTPRPESTRRPLYSPGAGYEVSPTPIPTRRPLYSPGAAYEQPPTPQPTRRPLYSPGAGYEVSPTPIPTRRPLYSPGSGGGTPLYSPGATAP